jgi:peptide/nickel transport system substrate-binding protein
MDAATDGLYRPVKSLQIPGSQYYSEAGAELLNQHNPEKAKQLLKESGYAGEKVVMMTSKDYLTRYISALVMAQQLQAIGINAELMVLDWPTALQKSMKGTPDWNYFYTGWMTYIAQGGQQTLRNMAEPAAVYDPPGGKVDERYMKLFRDVAFAPTQEERVKAFADAQRMVLEQVMIMPLGVVPKVQGMRANVEHYKPYWSPRLYNVWLRP